MTDKHDPNFNPMQYFVKSEQDASQQIEDEQARQILEDLFGKIPDGPYGGSVNHQQLPDHWDKTNVQLFPIASELVIMNSIESRTYDQITEQEKSEEIEFRRVVNIAEYKWIRGKYLISD